MKSASRQGRRAQLLALEQQRRSLIAALVKLDVEIAELRGVDRSSPFKRVDSTGVLDGADPEADSDSGFGD